MNLGPFSPTAYWEGFNNFLSSRPKALKPYLSLPFGIIIDLLDPPILSSVNNKNWPEELELHWRVKVVSPSLRVKNCLGLTPTTMCSMLYINQCAAFLPKKTDLIKNWSVLAQKNWSQKSVTFSSLFSFTSKFFWSSLSRFAVLQNWTSLLSSRFIIF